MPAPLAPITPTIPARGRSKQGLDQQPVPEALGDGVGGQYAVAQPGAGRDVDLDVLELDVALLGHQLLVAGQTRLRFRASALGVGPHPVQLGGDRALTGFLGAFLLGQACLLLLQPGGVVALVGDAFAAVELEDPAGHVVEEVAIVGDGHDRALVLGQVALQPGHRLGVEVVGGLVQQQQVRRPQQQAAECHPPALAPGEDRHVGVGWR